MPGKFEGEPEYVKDAWDMGLDGMADGDITYYGNPGWLFALDQDAEQPDPLVKSVLKELGFVPDRYLLVWQTEDGFVYHRWVNVLDTHSFSEE